MPVFAADLHNHTPASADHHRRSETAARDIVVSALGAGLDIYAATDHLDWGFSADLIEAADQVEDESGRRLLVVPGIELRITYRGDEAHIVALFDQDNYTHRFEALLTTLGVKAVLPGTDELPFFTFEYDPVDACRIIDALGGIACVAHADRAFGSYRLIERALFDRLLAETTVSAIDLIDPEASRARMDGCRPAIISCSDSHACGLIGTRRALLEMEELSFPALGRALAGNSVRETYCEPTLNLA